MTDTDARPVPPVAARRITARTHHGDTFDDPYEWLRAKDDAEVVAHLEAENAYTDARTAHLASLRDEIFGEIKGRTLETDLSVPARRGEWWYYGRTIAGAQYGIQCRAPLRSPDDWTPPQLSPRRRRSRRADPLRRERRGRRHRLLLPRELRGVQRRHPHAVRRRRRRRRALHRARPRPRHRETLADEIPGTFSGASFSPDGRFIVYTTVDDAWRPDTVWLHEIGTGVDADVKLFHEPDERYWVGADFTRSDRYLVIGVGSSITSEERLLDADDLRGEARVVWPRREGVEYSVEHAVVDGEDVLYILHNDGALDFELVRVAASDPQGARETVIAHRAGERLLGVDTFRDWGVVAYRRDGLARLGLLSYGDGTVTEIAFDEPLYSVGTGGNPEWAPPVLRVGYGSFVTPGTVYDYVIDTGELLLRKRQPVLGGFDPDDYGQARAWATADDGTRVPVSLVWKRSFGEPGASPRPVHLYGYGSYEHSIEPGFSVPRLSLLDRGVVFAVAHVRGGGEMGRQWYEDGKLQAKRNTFTDFVAVARHLVASGYTTPDRLVAEGGSAGGLLMGAVANLAPELFAGILADVPFVDALTTILDPSLPLTVIEWDEWGDPLHDADVYAYMKSYSPYENVREGVAYPRILAVTSLNDTRVLYVEPAKWVQRLREVGADALLKCEMVAGHGGVSGRYNAWRERAFELAWLLDVLGLAE